MTGKYVLIVRFYITPTRLLYRPFVKSKLHYVKSHIYKNYIFFTASINLFYSSSFLQSIDRWQFLLYIRSSSLSFEHNIPEIPYLTNEHQEKHTAGIYKMSNVLEMHRIGNLFLLINRMVWRGGVVLFEIWIHWQNQFFNCGDDFHDRSFQLSARWNPPIPRNIFKVLPHWQRWNRFLFSLRFLLHSSHLLWR